MPQKQGSYFTRLNIFNILLSILSFNTNDPGSGSRMGCFEEEEVLSEPINALHALLGNKMRF